MAFIDELKAYSKEYGLVLTEAQLQDFAIYYDRVVTTNEAMNLTAITEAKEFALKHIIDSLSCYDTQYLGKKILDLGTGAGFPGVPLGIYDRSLTITLFDSLQKRLTFLDQVTNELQLDGLTTLHGRAEDKAHEAAYREAFDAVTSRAVARLPILLEWALPYIKVGGYFVALKGLLAQEEVEESEKALKVLGGKIEEIREITLPTLSDKRAIIYIKKVAPTPKKYPRKPKEIKTKPLV